MDRRTAYAGALGASQDILYAGRHAMVGLGYALQDLMGASGVQIFGSACGPTTPTASLAVVMAPGRIYAPAQPLEATAWSSLAADTTDTLTKQGINLTSTTLTGFVAPGTAGQSINYLIEGQYQDVDQDNAVIAYFNASNPAVPFSGPGNAGTTQPRTRHGALAYQVKAGTAATTGSQTTPAADSGWTPMYVVTVANGQSTIVSGNIAAHPSMPQNSGNFNVTYVGGTTAPTANATYTIAGRVVMMTIPGLSAVSNSTGFSLSGVPSFLQTGSLPVLPCFCADNGTYAGAIAQIGSGSSITFFKPPAASWTASGTKAFAGGTFVYLLQP